MLVAIFEGITTNYYAFIGSGFIIWKNEKPVLVSCGHNFYKFKQESG